MKQSRRTRLDKMFLLKATLLAAMVVPAVGAYGQQEVDPTWYDPWAVHAKVAVQPAPSRAADHKLQRKVSSVAPNRQPRRARAKRSAIGDGAALCQNGISNEPCIQSR